MDETRFFVQFTQMGVNKKDPRIWDAYFSRHKLSLFGRWVTHLLCLHKNYSPPFQYAKLHIYEVIIVTCHRFFHPFFTVSTAASGREKKSHVARKITFYWKMFWLYIYNDMLHKMHYGCVDRGLRFFPVGLYNYVMLLWGYTNYSHIKKKLKKWHIEASVCRKISSQLGLCVYLPKIAFALLPTITTLFFTTNNKASNII